MEPELLLDVSIPVVSSLQRPVLQLEVSTPQRLELHLDVKVQ
jgi:hypothetical protein